MLVRIVDGDKLRSRAVAQSYMILLAFGWLAAYLGDKYAVDPLMAWLQAGDWPTWWLWLLEKTLSVPAYLMEAEHMPRWYDAMKADSAPWWAQALAFGSAIYAFICAVAMPYVAFLVGFLTVLMGIIALCIALWWVPVGFFGVVIVSSVINVWLSKPKDEV